MRRLTTRLVRSTNSLKALSHNSHANGSRTDLLGAVSEVGEVRDVDGRERDDKGRKRSGSKGAKEKGKEREREKGLRNTQSAMALSSTVAAPPLPPPKDTSGTSEKKGLKAWSKESDVRVEDTSPSPPVAAATPRPAPPQSESRKSEGDSHAQHRKSFVDFRAPKISTPYLANLTRKAAGKLAQRGYEGERAEVSATGQTTDPSSPAQAPTHRDMRRVAALRERGLLPASKRYSLLMNPPPDVEPTPEGGRDGMSAAEVLRRAWLESEGRDPDAKDAVVDESKITGVLEHETKDSTVPVATLAEDANAVQQSPSPSRSRTRSKPFPPPLDLAVSLQQRGKGRSLSPGPPSASPSQITPTSQSMPAISSSMSENDQIREKQKQKAQLNSWKFPASPSSSASVEAEPLSSGEGQSGDMKAAEGGEVGAGKHLGEQSKPSQPMHTSKSSGEVEVAKPLPTPSFPVIAPPRESSLHTGHPSKAKRDSEGREEADPARPQVRSKAGNGSGHRSRTSQNLSGSSSKNSVIAALAPAVTTTSPTEVPISPRLRPLPPSPRSPGSMDSMILPSLAAVDTNLATTLASSASASEKVAAWLDRTPLASPRAGSQPASGSVTPVPTLRQDANTDDLARLAPIVGAVSTLRLPDAVGTSSVKTGANFRPSASNVVHSPSPTPTSLVPPSLSRLARSDADQKVASSPSKSSAVPTLSHTISTATTSTGGPKTPTANSVEGTDLLSSASDAEMNRASLSVESSVGESLPLSTPPLPGRIISQKESTYGQASAVIDSPVESEFRLLVEDSGTVHNLLAEQKLNKVPSMALDTLHEEEGAPDFVIPATQTSIANHATDRGHGSGHTEVTGNVREERARKTRSTLFGRRRNKDSDLVSDSLLHIDRPSLTMQLSLLCNARLNVSQTDIAIPEKPYKSTSLTNLRRTVTSGFTSARAKPSPKHSLPLPAKRDPSPLRSDSSATTSASPSSPFLSPRYGAFNGRTALSPTMHSRASIIVQADTIDDDESRRLSELAFLY